MANEIIEEGITAILVSRSSNMNREFTPAGQRAKWFRDDLDQLWVKFDVAESTLSQDVVTHVIPASRVVDVQYLRRGNPS